MVRNGNNNLLLRCDELWVYGDVSDGVLSEINTFTKTGKPVRYFDISGLPESVVEVELSALPFESDVEKYRHEFM